MEITGQMIFNAALTLGVTIVGGFVHEIKGNIKKRLDDCENDIMLLSGKIAQAQEDLSAFRVEAQKDFVSREDHIRVTQGFDAKLDRLLNEIHKVDKNVARIMAAQGVEHE
jgi:outer membrane murein-binding lipoprotein Lpp